MPPPTADAASAPRIPPNADGRAEKRFPCCAGRDCFPPPLASAFGEFAPRADSGLRDAGRTDADGGEPAPREPRENRPWTRRECSGGIIPRNFPLRPACPPNLQNLGGLADAPARPGHSPAGRRRLRRKLL